MNGTYVPFYSLGRLGSKDGSASTSGTSTREIADLAFDQYRPLGQADHFHARDL